MKSKQKESFEKIFRIGDKIHDQIISSYKSSLIKKMKKELNFASEQQYDSFGRGYREAVTDVLKLLEEK